MVETLHSLLRRQLSSRPGAPAFLIAAGDRSLPITWQQFCRDVDALAWAGIKYVGKGERVGIIGENSYEWIVTHAACLMSGVVAVPLEPSLSAQDMAQRLAFVEARFVVHSVLYEDKMRDVAKLLPGVFFMSFGSAAVDYMLERGTAAVAKGEAESVFAKEPDEDALASIVFTSGTTAKPRGVELSLRSFSMFPAWATKMLPANPGDRSLMVLPLHHIFGIASTYFLLSRGVALGVCPDFRRLFDAVQRFRATRLFLVPALAEILAHKLNNRQMSDWRIEWILTGGAPLPRRVYEHLQSFGIRMLEGYGLTETCSLYSLAPFEEPRVGTAGRVAELPGVETKVSDDGELLIRGPNVMLGYYHDDAATGQAMKDGWFRTGDVGEIDADGYVKVIGRRNRTIVLSSGKKVSPEELENLLAGLPGLMEAVVSGEGDSRRLVAEVYSRLPEKVVKDQIDAVNRSLPIYKRIRQVVVRNEPFPRTASGKIRMDAHTDLSKEKGQDE